MRVGPGNRQLAAYYTPRRPGEQDGSAEDKTQDLPSGASLRSFLSARVPGFMVPAVFIAMDQLPLTPRGEKSTGRRFLIPRSRPAGAWTEATRRYRRDCLICGPGSSIQGGVSLDDDFFQLGGNSLLAAEMLAHVRVMFGISPNYVRPLTRSLLRDPTLRGFSKATQNARAGRLTADGADPRVDFIREAELVDPVRLDAGPQPGWKRPRKILLTGSTGFFGIHLLRELLTATNAEVHCLVRARMTPRMRCSASSRLPNATGSRAWLSTASCRWSATSPNRIWAWPRHIRRAGADDRRHLTMPARLVNFTYPYQDLRAANVTGTRELIRLAGLYRAYLFTTFPPLPCSRVSAPWACGK